MEEDAETCGEKLKTLRRGVAEAWLDARVRKWRSA
jgi:hypothetical protein